MAGFNSPNILFLNTYDALDRKYMLEISPKLKSAGYNRYVELYVGGFAMPIVMATSGVRADDMYCYDISLYSNILGYTFSGKNLEELQVKKNGELICLEQNNPIKSASILLYEQALARLEKASNIIYFANLIKNLKVQRDYHIAKIAESVKHMDSLLHGLHFEHLYIWDAFKKEKDSENTFIVSNPPTYRGAYEKFFDTDGVITWSGDSTKYEIWDGKVDCKRIMEEAQNAKALLFLLQQADKGKAATENPVSSRYLSLTQNVYYNCNRPEEIERINGLKETTAQGAKREKSKYQIMHEDYEITENSKVAVFVEDSKVAEYYRRIWLHRITGKAVSINLCVVIDGYLMGYIGLDFNPLIRSYQDKSDFIILSYAVPAPNERLRNARLLVHLARSKKIIEDALSSSKQRQFLFYLSSANELCTVEYSRYHEVKGLRGLMKIRNKKKINEELNALTYFTALNEKSKEECLADFIKAEKQYSNGK